MSMTHEEVMRLTELEVDGLLPPEELQRLNNACASSSALAAVREGVRREHDALHILLGQSSVPASLSSSIMARCSAPPREQQVLSLPARLMRGWMRAAAVFLVALGLVYMLQLPRPSEGGAETAGQILHGVAQDGGGWRWVPYSPDGELQIGDALRTGKGARTAFLLFDGGRVALNENTLVEFLPRVFGGKQRLRLHSGEIWVRLAGNERGWVETDSGVMASRDANFYCRYDLSNKNMPPVSLFGMSAAHAELSPAEKALLLQVMEGEVVLLTKDRREIIRKGERVRVIKGSNVFERAVLSSGVARNWATPFASANNPTGGDWIDPLAVWLEKQKKRAAEKDGKLLHDKK